jgi:hypothetical protein
VTREPPGPWATTPGLLPRLVELYASPKHYTAREMANMLSVEFDVPITRNAVIGKSNRLRLPVRIRPVPTGPKPKKYSPRPRKNLIEKPLRIEPEGTVTIYQLRSDDCRFPLGDYPFVFCGKEQRGGKSYCNEHYSATHLRKEPA